MRDEYEVARDNYEYLHNRDVHNIYFDFLRRLSAQVVRIDYRVGVLFDLNPEACAIATAKAKKKKKRTKEEQETKGDEESQQEEEAKEAEEIDNSLPPPSRSSDEDLPASPPKKRSHTRRNEVARLFEKLVPHP